MAPDSFDVVFSEQSFHLILKFLAYEVVFQDRDDQNRPELWHRLVGENPAVNNLCAGNERRGHNREDGQCQEGEAHFDSVRSRAKTDRREFR